MRRSASSLIVGFVPAIQKRVCGAGASSAGSGLAEGLDCRDESGNEAGLEHAASAPTAFRNCLS